MSTPNNREERTLDFSGFSELFDELERHEENIRVALNRYSTLQGTNEPVSSTPLGSPESTPATPFITPVGSPRSSIRIDSSQSVDQSRSNSEPSILSDIALAISSLPEKSSTSLQDIHLISNPLTDNIIMTPTAGQKKHEKALNAFNKVYRKVVKLCKDLDKALMDTDTDVYRLRRLTSRLYADANSRETRGKMVEEFEEQDFSEGFDEDQFYDEFEEASREAESLIKCGNDEIDKRDAVIPQATPSPKADQTYKYEKLQVEPFDGDHTIWPYWREQAKDFIKDMPILKQRMWLIAKIQGDAREFIGITNLNTLTIDKIFARLNANYGQPHMRAKTIAIANNDMAQLDENATMQEIEKFWNKSMNVADQCAELKITAESLTITHAMLHLPPKFRERLEVKMREVKVDYKFTRADAVTPFNLVKAEMLSSYPDTGSAHSYASSPVIPNSPNAELNSGTGNGSAGRGRGHFYPNRTDGDRGQVSPGYSYGYSNYTQRGQQPNRFQKCFYCNGDHRNEECHHYDTPQQKRERLVALKKCRACMRDEQEHGKLCAPRARCSDHPGEKHFWHLCDGPNVKHPGSQFTQCGPRNASGTLA